MGSSPVGSSAATLDSESSAGVTVAVRDLRVSTRDVELIRGVSFDVPDGAILGVAGESGSGKSLTCLAMLGLLGPGLTASGTIACDGVDVLGMTARQIRGYRARTARIVFQDPSTSLNPVLTVGHQLMESVRSARKISARDAREAAAEMIASVGIADPRQRLDAYPRELSGGMLQRIVIAMALLAQPRFLICDEPTTALDVTTQAQILDLIHELNRTTGTAVVLTTHDMSVVADHCDQVVVMYGGQIIETGPAQQTLSTPQHPYTWALLSALPTSNTGSPRERLVTLDGAPPAPGVELPGCRFEPRCPYAEARCSVEEPVLQVLNTAGDRSAACLLTAPEGSRHG